VQAYCFRCKKKVGINSPKEVKLRNKKKAVAGNCPVCNAKVYTFGRGVNPAAGVERNNR
jgi:hypothetical protein